MWWESLKSKEQAEAKTAVQGGEGMEREQTTIRLPAELKKRLQQEAERKGQTVKDIVLFILYSYLQNNSQE